MTSCSIAKLSDPKSFCFQFSATFFTLFFLTNVSCKIGCVVTAAGTSITLFYLTWQITRLIRKKYFDEFLPVDKKVVLVTGCDTGFGHRLAARLNKNGYIVYAGCLNTNGKGPQELLRTSAYPNQTKLVTLDVTNEEDVQTVHERIAKDLKQNKQMLWAIVNNAGISKLSHVEWGKLQDCQKILDVNIMGTVRATRAFLPLIRKSKGRVINVSSLAGRIAGPGLSSYCMSKHAVVAFSTALRREMAPWGVKVSTIEPAGYSTAMTNPEVCLREAKEIWAETPGSIRKSYGQGYFDSTLSFFEVNDHTGDPEEVVDAMMHAISSVEPDIFYRVCGWKYTIGWFLNDYLPYSIMDMLAVKRDSKVKPSGA